jgi:hypothetical protein
VLGDLDQRPERNVGVLAGQIPKFAVPLRPATGIAAPPFFKPHNRFLLAAYSQGALYTFTWRTAEFARLLALFLGSAKPDNRTVLQINRPNRVVIVPILAFVNTDAVVAN